jgi:hypothetical protein
MVHVLKNPASRQPSRKNDSPRSHAPVDPTAAFEVQNIRKSPIGKRVVENLYVRLLLRSHTRIFLGHSRPASSSVAKPAPANTVANQTRDDPHQSWDKGGTRDHAIAVGTLAAVWLVRQKQSLQTVQPVRQSPEWPPAFYLPYHNR